MVTHNFETVLKHFGRRKELKLMWNYATGLRGNDDCVADFKEIVTTVIRGNVKCAFSFNEYFMPDMLRDYKRDPEYYAIKFQEKLDTVEGHSVQHAHMALNALAEYYRHKHQFAFASELIRFGNAIGNRNASSALIHWKNLHEMWG